MRFALAAWLRDALLWRSARPFAQSVIYAVIIVAVSLAARRSAIRADATAFDDGHAVVSLDLALARVYCGAPSSFGRTVRVAEDIKARLELRHVAFRELLARKAGSIDAYCRAIDTPFVNSENSLILIEVAVLRVAPGLSLARLGQVLQAIKLGCLALFALLLLDLGSSIAFALATFFCGLLVLQSMPDFVYSNYTFLFPLILLAVTLHAFAIKYRWTDRAAGRLAYGAAAGALSAFVANMRTSYLPIVGAFFLCVLLAELWRRQPVLPWTRRAARAAALVGAFALAYVAFQQGLITRHLPEGEGRFNASHPIAHALVLALAVPGNDFSRAMGLRWADEVGPQIAARVDPGAPYPGRRYDAALLRYYTGLWRGHAREMFATYVLKFSTAGSEMLGVLRRSPGPIGGVVRVLLTPLALLPNGLWLLGLYAAVTAGALVVYHTRGGAAAFAMALLGLAACLVQLESSMIFSLFTKQYHNYAEFYALFLSLCGAQALAQSACALRR